MTMSGMAHGVEVSFGKVMVMDAGAGLVPSDASSSAQSPSAGGVQLYFSSPLAFSVLTQRSEPAGDGAVASPSAWVNCSAWPSSETPETVLCAVAPTQASTSSGRPAASIKLPSPLTVIVTVPSCSVRSFSSKTVSGAAVAPEGAVAVTVSGGAQNVFWPIPASSVRRPSSTSATAVLKRKILPIISGHLASIVTVLLPQSQIGPVVNPFRGPRGSPKRAP